MNYPTPAYLVDTDWVISFLTGSMEYRDKLRDLGHAQLGISIVSVAELYEGAHYARDPENSLRHLERFLEGIPVVGIDEEICKTFGRERGRLRQTGLLIGDFDLLIASTALHLQIPLCTNNRRHFGRIDDLTIISLS